MKYKFLVGDIFYGLGKKLSAALEQLGFETVCCCNEYASLRENLERE